jgi:membrane-bound serine protease (ClpP class)
MMRSRLLPLLLGAVLWLAPPGASGAPTEIYLLNASGSVNPGLVDFLTSGIEKAEKDGAAVVVIALDTPGGLADSMREIVKSILGSPVPVVVFVSPGGARAASAGVMITMAADVAAMAPGTNIGAAHPVGLGGKDMDGSMSEKVTNDMVAYACSIAAKRGRNVEWVEKAVRESVSITESEALKLNVIDLVAEDLDDLLRQLEGREVPGKGRLSLAAARVTTLQEDFRTKVLRTISNPNIAYILLMIGMAGLFFELSHPGAVFPGVVGGIAIILAFFAFQTLPVNATGILLIILAAIFFVLEIFIVSYGLLSIAGIGALLLGSLMLFEGEKAGVRLSWTVLVPTVAVVSGFFIAVAGLVVKTHLSKPRTGAIGLVGEIGVVKMALEPHGKVFVHGELWNAQAGVPVAVGARVRVVAVQGLLLEVEPETR